jgi:hypothetical protein
MNDAHPDTTLEIPFVGRWHYSRAEMIADGIVHAVGIVLAIAAGSAFLALAAFHSGPGEYIAAVFYVVSLLTVLSVSLAYNLWPVSWPAKWILRRFDHAAIYLLIAATYTPFLAQLDNSPLALPMIVVVWSAALAGIAIKMFLPGRYDRLAIVFYLASAGAASYSPDRWSTRCRRPPSRCSSPAASSIPAASSSSPGRACASTMRCGTASSSPAPAFIWPPWSIALSSTGSRA